MRKQIAYIVAFLLTVFSFPLSAQEKADGEGEKAFDPKETIFEHLLDGYGWELPFSHEHKIPLPVIVRDYKGDWKYSGRIGLNTGRLMKVFMSLRTARIKERSRVSMIGEIVIVRSICRLPKCVGVDYSGFHLRVVCAFGGSLV